MCGLQRIFTRGIRTITIMYKNLKEKYGITAEELKKAIDQIKLGKIACDGIVLVALCDLLCNGDIPSLQKD